MTTFFWPVCIIAGANCVPVSGAGCRLARPPALLAWQHWGQARILGLSWCLGKYKDARPAAGTSQCRQPAGERERERERGEQRMWQEIITTLWSVSSSVIGWWSQHGGDMWRVFTSTPTRYYMLFVSHGDKTGITLSPRSYCHCHDEC